MWRNSLRRCSHRTRKNNHCFDVLRRFLESQKIPVEFVQNFTDVDDKIIERAHQEKLHHWNLLLNIPKTILMILIV